MENYSINIKGKLLDLSTPKVMGILNVTPDSFYDGSRKVTDEEVAQRVSEIVSEGGDMIDIGAYSSRPGADEVSVREEMERLRMGMRHVREVAPDMPVSVDTFRADVARMAVEELGVDIVNDISGGELDERMFTTVAELGVPYILMHMKAHANAGNEVFSKSAMQQTPEYDNVTADVMKYFAERVQRLRNLGQKDIILDPGYGFSKTLEQNYELLSHQEALGILELPVLVGVSRKSMIYRVTSGSPQDALNGTTALNMMALMKGASILRVHDVKECVEVVRIFEMTRPSTPFNH